MPQISLKDITKTFKVAQRPEGKLSALRSVFVRENKIIKALNRVSFDIEEGELVGYIGPNGAGKSTTVKVMSGILTPEAGSCQILGRIPWKERIKHAAHIGVVFGQRSQLWWDLPTSDSFILLKDIYDISAAEYKTRFNALVEAMDIGSLLKTPVRQLSLGQRMRCEVAASLLHRPEILFLDEPTIGLDAVSKLSLRSFLKEENRKNGVTMILTTHDMDDIEALCGRIMVIGHGELLFDGSLAGMRSRFSPLRRIKASVREGGDFITEKIPIDGVLRTEVKGNDLTVWFDPQKTPAHEIVAIMAGRLPLVDIMIEEQNIDEMTATMYKEMKL